MSAILPVLHIFSKVLMLFAFAFLLPLGVSIALDDGAQLAYDEAILITFFSGMALWLISRRGKRELHTRDGFLLVVMIWALLPVFSAIPLMVYLPDLAFNEAYFEAVSGLTATGATVLSGLDSLPPSINIWRTQMHWIGGMGVIVLVVAVLPMLGVGGRQLFKAETPTPMKDSKLTPRMAETAKGLWVVYALITVICMLALWAGGMDWIDAVVHGFSVMGLGGMSSHDASMAYFDSLRLEMIVMFFALVAGVSFSTHFMAFRMKSFMAYRLDAELPWFFGVLAVSALGLAGYLLYKGFYLDFPEALRFAAFNTVSVATTLGFSSTDYNVWPYFAPLWMLFLSSFAASSGSTGGGIKMLRAVLLSKQLYRELIKLIHPNAEIHTKIGRQAVPNKIIYAVLAFLFVYVASVVTLSFVLSASGLDIFTSFTAVVAMVNNTGPGLGQVGPASTYAVLNDFQTWVCSFAMLLGRLEFFTLLVVLTPVFWRK
ncbi:MAG: potassium transporter Trk [Hydrogenophilales bacterium 16-64-46]|nr:MAG: potassium transporter Trk [Hydrogenophilales bacterium 12-64-13]OYZ06799.1 MAG: potassium transporter Trk [Hydrogenophilales bacterium 16-64-46]OZA39506.1 MAG: potassium transporter Trk [Hydrogenophilales bacterium 17-64-34]HQS99814.1 potassium transporter TrkG [Thiobacillus sp.]